ncbi:MAG: lysine decarboxylase [Acidobacteria bacterium]|nr:MAG: lysine decarboxylase [Acidobacteriota bacterium]
MAKNKSEISRLPFLNTEFLKSPAARTIRILSEYLEPAERLRRARIRDTIVFFGSARSPSPEQAAQQLAEVNEQIVRAGSVSAELSEARTRAGTAVRLARYYRDAVDLSRRLTEWSKSLTGNYDFIICSGGSGGMMEAANRGASLAGGKTIGFNIQLPHEQAVNSYVPRELVFNFYYFFMRKFWFLYLAKALVIFPGGFGTMDEFFEVLTLIQTKKPRKTMPVVLFGNEYWDEVINFDAFVRWGTVSAEELQVFYKTDSVDDAYKYLTGKLEGLYTTPEGLEQIKLT